MTASFGSQPPPKAGGGARALKTQTSESLFHRFSINPVALLPPTSKLIEAWRATHFRYTRLAGKNRHEGPKRGSSIRYPLGIKEPSPGDVPKSLGNAPKNEPANHPSIQLHRLLVVQEGSKLIYDPRAPSITGSSAKIRYESLAQSCL